MEQTIEKLLHQEFDSKMRGYDRDQVDDFLDEVVEDIEKLQTKYNLLLDEKKILEKNNFELKMKLLDMKEKLGANEVASATSILGETKLVGQNNFEQQTQVSKLVQPTVASTTSKPAQAAPSPDLQIRKPQPTAEPITHEDSKANDHTLQDRIELLERELNNIKNFTDQ